MKSTFRKSLEEKFRQLQTIFTEDNSVLGLKLKAEVRMCTRKLQIYKPEVMTFSVRLTKQLTSSKKSAQNL